MSINLIENSQSKDDSQTAMPLCNVYDFFSDYTLSLNHEEQTKLIQKLNLPISTQTMVEMAEQGSDVLCKYVQSYHHGFTQDSIEAAYLHLESR